MITNILLPTDGSETAMNASELAIDMAKRYDAKLHVLSNLDPISQVANPQISRQIMDERRDDAEEEMNDVASRAEEEGVTVRMHVTDLDSASEAIQSYCEDQDVDLVVMGTHGHSGLNRFLLGSTTERTLRSASIPVLAVPPSEEPAADEA